MIVPTSRTTLNEETNITETDNKIEIRLSALQSACHNSAICITSHMPQIFQVVKDRSPQTAESHGHLMELIAASTLSNTDMDRNARWMSGFGPQRGTIRLHIPDISDTIELAWNDAIMSSLVGYDSHIASLMSNRPCTVHVIQRAGKNNSPNWFWLGGRKLQFLAHRIVSPSVRQILLRLTDPCCHGNEIWDQIGCNYLEER